MRAGVTQRATNKPKRAWRMLAISLVLSLLFGLAGMGEPMENALRVARNKANPVAASGDIVIATIDDASQAALGTWPWPRSLQARMIDRLSDAGASKIFLDLTVQFKTGAKGDQDFADAVVRSGKVVLPIHLRAGEGDGIVANRRPYVAIGSHAQLGLISMPYNFSNEVWRLPYSLDQDGEHYRSFAAIMAGVEGPRSADVPDQLSDRHRHHSRLQRRRHPVGQGRCRTARQDGHHRRHVGKYRRHVRHSGSRTQGRGRRPRAGRRDIEARPAAVVWLAADARTGLAARVRGSLRVAGFPTGNSSLASPRSSPWRLRS